MNELPFLIRVQLNTLPMYFNGTVYEQGVLTEAPIDSYVLVKKSSNLKTYQSLGVAYGLPQEGLDASNHMVINYDNNSIFLLKAGDYCEVFDASNMISTFVYGSPSFTPDTPLSEIEDVLSGQLSM